MKTSRTNQLQFGVSGVTGTHPLSLARELSARSLLQTYYTTLPASRTLGVPASRTKRHLALLLGIYAVGRGWVPAMLAPRLQHSWGYEFDRWIAARLEPADVIQALPGCGLKLRRAAKGRFGALTVCDSGTSHERYQAQLLEEEARRWGVERVPGSEAHLRYVEAEYEEADLITVPTDDLGRVEAKEGRPLKGSERLGPWVQAEKVRRACRRARDLSDIPRLTQEAFAQYAPWLTLSRSVNARAVKAQYEAQVGREYLPHQSE